MPVSLEVVERSINDFSRVQRRMVLAKKENATETYADLKDEYRTLKALLNVAGVIFQKSTTLRSKSKTA